MGGGRERERERKIERKIYRENGEEQHTDGQHTRPHTHLPTSTSIKANHIFNPLTIGHANWLFDNTLTKDKANSKAKPRLVPTAQEVRNCAHKAIGSHSLHLITFKIWHHGYMATLRTHCPEV